jgi:hypothetical protein
MKSHSVVPRPTIDALPRLASLSLEDIAESVRVETFNWTPQMYSQVMSHIGPQQRKFVERIVTSGGEHNGDICDALGLKSGKEARNVITTLRKQLRSLGVNPQEVYVAEFTVDGNGDLDRHYYATGTFHQIWSEINNPREIKRRGIA